MTERQVLDARTPQQWEEWLERHHDTTYGEAVEIALCFGWVDSLARDTTTFREFSGSARESRAARGRSPMSNGCNGSSMPDACDMRASV